MRCWCQPIQPMSHLREGLIAMSASHRCSSNTPPPTQHQLPHSVTAMRVKTRESCGILKHVVFSFQSHSRDYIWLNGENPESYIISVWFLIPHASRYPKGRCFNAYLLLLFFPCQGRGHFIPERWSVELSVGFHVPTLKEGFRKKKQFPLHCLSKSPPKQLLLSQRASEALDQY